MNNLRGINQKLLTAFKNSVLYSLPKNNPKEFLCCIRNNAIGLYYNADRVAMVSLNNRGELRCKISSYYLSDHYLTKGKRRSNSEVEVSPEEILHNLEIIKANSEERSTPEKKAQQALIHANNSNPNSDWICVDIEYRQSTKVQKDGKFLGRFDIIAISKTVPHQVAIIELKYNNKAIGGDSGVVKHLEDFYLFQQSSYCYVNLKKEIVECVQNLIELELLPKDSKISDCPNSFFYQPEFFMICLYDSVRSTRGTVGGYLFDGLRKGWGTRRVSEKNAMRILDRKYNDIFDVESEECAIKVNFLFKKVRNSLSPDINDILNTNEYNQ